MAAVSSAGLDKRYMKDLKSIILCPKDVYAFYPVFKRAIDQLVIEQEALIPNGRKWLFVFDVDFGLHMIFIEVCGY